MPTSSSGLYHGSIGGEPAISMSPRPWDPDNWIRVSETITFAGSKGARVACEWLRPEQDEGVAMHRGVSQEELALSG